MSFLHGNINSSPIVCVLFAFAIRNDTIYDASRAD